MRLKGFSCAALLAAAALSACGGGGSGGDNNNHNGGNGGAAVPPPTPVVPPAGAWLTITPSPIAISTYDGESVAFSVTAKSSRIVEKPFNIAIIDGKSVVSTDVTVTSVSELEYVAKLRTASALALGTHTTNLEVRLCEDEPLVCNKPLPGSPWLVPLSVTVKPTTNLTALNVLPGVAAWGTYQGNASHTGFVPASFSASKFERRWSAALSTQTPLNGIAVDNGVVFATRGGAFGEWTLLAISEQTGQTLWSVNLGTLYRVNAPAAANGKVFVTSTGHGDTYFWIFDQTTGALLGKTPMSSQWETYLAPTVYGDSVYTNSGSYGGLSKFRSADASLEWFNGGLPQFDGWTPAVDATHAYGYLSGNLYAIRTADGTNDFQIQNPYYSWAGYTGAAVVLGKGIGYVSDAGRVLGFDLTTRTVAWSAENGALGQPALANDVLYVAGAGGTTLEARNPATGQPLWLVNLAHTQDERFNNVVVTGSHAFLSSSERTVAVDLATRTVVWSLQSGGVLSISNRGVLYIVSTNGRLVAVNLQ